MYHFNSSKSKHHSEMSDSAIMKKTTLGGDAVLLTTSNILTMCISTLTSMLLARFRTLEEYGTFSQLLLVINLFASIFMLGVPNSINYFLARADNNEKAQRFLSVFYTINTILSIMLGVVLVCAIPLIELYFNNPEIRRYAYFLALYPWASIISVSIVNVLVVYKKTTFLLIYKLLNSILILGTVLIVQLLGLGFQEYMIGNLGVCVLFALCVYIIVSKLSGGMKISTDRTLIKEILVFSLPLGFSTIIGTLDLEIDKLLIGRMMNTQELAIYSNAAKELPLTIVSSSITAVLLPQVSKMIKRKENINAAKLWGEATELSFVFMGLFVAGIFTYAGDVIEILYSKKYLAGVPVFQVYSLVLLLRVSYFGMLLNAMGKTKDIMTCSIWSLILNAVLNPLFFELMGIIGPAIATFLSIFIVQMYQLWLTSKHIEMSFKDIFPWFNCGKILATNIAFGFVFYMIKEIVPLDKYVGSAAESVFLGVIWSGVYILVMKDKIKTLWNRINAI